MVKATDQLHVLKRLNFFSQSSGRITSIEELAVCVSEILDDLLEIELSGLYLYDFVEKKLKLLVAKGFTAAERVEAEKTAMERHPGYIFRTGKTIDIPDTENDPEQLTILSERSFVVRSRLYFPVRNGNQIVGAFGILSSQKNRFSEEYKVILSFICSIAGEIYATISKNAEQKKARDHLAAITIRLETLIKNLQSGLLVEDQDRRIALVNKTFCDMFGIPVDPDLLLGSDCSDSAEQSKHLFTHPEKFVSRIAQILVGKKTVTGEELELADGRMFERDYVPIFLEGQFLGNLWQYRDVSARVRIENDLRKATAEALAANSAKSIFLANMSHEIRTPLNAVIGLSRLMRDTDLNVEQKILNDKLLISGENLLGIINEILDFSKIEAGRVELESIPFSLNSVLDRVYHFLSHAAEEKSVTLSSSMDKPFQKAVIGDPGRLHLVLTNLVNNAIKFTSDGKVIVTCTLVRQAGEKAAFLFSVADTGIGINEENLKNIFEKFKQEDDSVTRIYGGTGLGLAISKQLVGLMGGDLQVESKKGIGSRFFFTLDFDTTDQAVLREANRKIFIDTDILSNKVILVVEDNEFNQFIAKSILVKWNVLVDLASNGKEAIEKVRHNAYDLILMDMQMPVMDGCTATRIIRDELHVTTQVIALTAYATKEAIEKSLAAGMNGYVAKPFDEETLFAQLLSAFGLPPRYIAESEAWSETRSGDENGGPVHYDLEKITELLGGEKTEILDVIEKFIKVTPEYSSALYYAFEQNNIEELAKAAHKIKSSLELLASGDLRNNIILINEYARDRVHLEKLSALVEYSRRTIPVLLRQLGEKATEMRNDLHKRNAAL